MTFNLHPTFNPMKVITFKPSPLGKTRLKVGFEGGFTFINLHPIEGSLAAHAEAASSLDRATVKPGLREPPRLPAAFGPDLPHSTRTPDRQSNAQARFPFGFDAERRGGVTGP